MDMTLHDIVSTIAQKNHPSVYQRVEKVLTLRATTRFTFGDNGIKEYLERMSQYREMRATIPEFARISDNLLIYEIFFQIKRVHPGTTHSTTIFTKNGRNC